MNGKTINDLCYLYRNKSPVMRNVIYVLIFFSMHLSAQPRKADSLINVLNTKNHAPEEQLELYDLICASITNELEKSIKYGRKGLVLAEREKNKVKASRFNNAIAGAYDAMAKYDSSFIYFNRALALGVEADNKNRQIAAIMNLGNSFTRQSKYRIALEYYMKTLELCDSIESPNLYIGILGNIAEIHLELKNYDRAYYYVEKTLHRAEKTDDTGMKMQAYFILGCIYHEWREYDKALHYQFISAQISHDIHYITYECYSTQAIANTYIALKDYNNALKYANRCLNLAGELNDPKLVARAWSVLCDIYLEQNQYKKAEIAAYTAWELDSLSLDIAPRIAFTIGLINAFAGNKEKAELFFRKHNVLKDDYIDKTYREAMLDMEVKYEMEKKEVRITTLEKEKRFYVWLGISGILILILTLSMLFYRYRLMKQKREIAEQQIKQFEQKEQLITTQAALDGEAAERSRLARDLHDGLGGMLSVIKLNLEDIKEPPSAQEGDATRFTIALDVLDRSIDELRYIAHYMMPESLMRCGLKTSLEDFCQAIPGANFQYYGNEERLDGHLEMVIYRCAYELINNVVKHANASVLNIQLMIDSELITLSVYDNGIGFNPNTIPSGTGLENIRTRISAYKGTMNIYSSPGEGSEINIEIERTFKKNLS